MSIRKRIREIERKVGVVFVAVAFTGSGHVRLTLPNGRRVTCSATPSCPFATQHIAGDIRRALQHGGRA